MRSSRPDVFCKKRVLKNFVKFREFSKCLIPISQHDVLRLWIFILKLTFITPTPTYFIQQDIHDNRYLYMHIALNLWVDRWRFHVNKGMFLASKKEIIIIIYKCWVSHIIWSTFTSLWRSLVPCSKCHSQNPSFCIYTLIDSPFYFLWKLLKNIWRCE